MREPDLSALPCRMHDADLWFAEDPRDLEQAKALCAGCPVRLACLAVAADRAEFAGVWGGHIFSAGRIVAHKRPRGRPRKQPAEPEPQQAGVAVLRAGGDDADPAGNRLEHAERALVAAQHDHDDVRARAASAELRAAAAGYLAARAARAGRRHLLNRATGLNRATEGGVIPPQRSDQLPPEEAAEPA